MPSSAAVGKQRCGAPLGVRSAVGPPSAWPSCRCSQARAAGLPIRVSALSPGVVDTEFFAVRAYGDEAAAAAAKAVLPSRLVPADVAAMVAWVLGAPDHVEVNDVVVRPREQAI